MKHLFRNLTLIVVVLSFSLTSCEKEEEVDTCNDGVQSIGEEGVDCGGPCPPCEEPPNNPIALATINGTEIQFSTYILEKDTDWVMYFANDSVSVTVNLGNGDSLGTRPLKVQHSTSKLFNKEYGALKEGKSLFEKIDHDKKELTFYFEADFGMKPSDPSYNSLDSLFVRSTTFKHIPWD